MNVNTLRVTKPERKPCFDSKPLPSALVAVVALQQKFVSLPGALPRLLLRSAQMQVFTAKTQVRFAAFEQNAGTGRGAGPKLREIFAGKRSPFRLTRRFLPAS
jgi:hypothetical protein